MLYSTLAAKKNNNIISFPQRSHAATTKPTVGVEQWPVFVKVLLLVTTAIGATVVLLNGNGTSHIAYAGALFLTGLLLQIVVPVTYQMLRWLLIRVAGEDSSVRIAAAIITLTMVPFEGYIIYTIQKLALQMILD